MEIIGTSLDQLFWGNEDEEATPTSSRRSLPATRSDRSLLSLRESTGGSSSSITSHSGGGAAVRSEKRPSPSTLRPRVSSGTEVNKGLDDEDSVDLFDDSEPRRRRSHTRKQPLEERWTFLTRPELTASGLSVVGLLGSGQYGRVVLCGRPSSTHPVVADLSNDQLLGVAPIQEPPKRRRSFLAKLVPGGSKQKGARESVELDERNERFALKILDKARFSRPKQERYALNERMAMRSLNHPFHLKFINAFVTQGSLCLLTEYVEGGSLLDRVKTLSAVKKKKNKPRERLSNDEVRFYTASIILALKYMHERGIIHRDIKLANILISRSGHIKICDYGFAKPLEIGQTTRTFVGTYSTMSPEQCVREPYNHSIDLWALGISMFEMTYLFSPFSADEHDTDFAKKVMRNILRAPIPFPRTDDVRLGLKQLIMRLLEKDPTIRLGADLDYAELMRDPWLDVVNWRALESQSFPAPWTPEPKD